MSKQAGRASARRTAHEKSDTPKGDELASLRIPQAELRQRKSVERILGELEDRAVSGKLLVELLLADGVARQAEAQRGLQRCVDLLEKLDQSLPASSRKRRSEAKAPLDGDLRERVKAARKAVEDLASRSQGISEFRQRSLPQGDLDPIPERQIRTCLENLRVHRASFQSKMLEFPAVADAWRGQVTRVAAGELSAKSITFWDPGIGRTEAEVRVEAQEILRRISEVEEPSVGGSEAKHNAQIAALLCRLPMKPERALQIAAQVERDAARLAALENSSEDLCQSNSAVVSAELQTLRAGLGGQGPEVADRLAELRELREPYLRLRDYVVAVNERLVQFCAGRIRRGVIEFEELLQAGSLGLMRAVERFNPAATNRFSTFAVWWIRQQIFVMRQEESPLIKLPRNLITPLRTLQRLSEHNTSRSANEDVLEALDLKRWEKAGVSLVRRQILSIDQRLSPFGEGEERLDSVLEDTRLPDSHLLAEKHELLEMIDQTMSQLSERERLVIRKRFGPADTKMTLEAIAKELKLTKERVRQIEENALNSLRWLLRKFREN